MTMNRLLYSNAMKWLTVWLSPVPAGAALAWRLRRLRRLGGKNPSVESFENNFMPWCRGPKTAFFTAQTPLLLCSRQQESA